MDKRLQEIMDNYEKMKIGLDDSFRFHCTMCGKCCRNREDIILNPFDVYRMAKDLKMHPAEMFTAYCDTFLGHTSRMVIVRLKPQGPDMHCPLLKGNRCAVHKAKPTVCALFPLGRTLSTKLNEPANLKDREVQYILQDPGCGNKSETHTVREWLNDFDIPTDDGFFAKWSQTVFDYGNIVKKLIDMLGEENIGMLFTVILGNIYLNYDIEKPFLSQFERNDTTFREMIIKTGIVPDSGEGTN